MNSSWSRFNITTIVLGFAFLYIPIVLLVIFSFNESKLVTVWGGFSTKWYVSLFHNQGLMAAAWVTIRVGLISATMATVLGTFAALALTRYTRFRGRVLFSGMAFAPLVMLHVAHVLGPGPDCQVDRVGERQPVNPLQHEANSERPLQLDDHRRVRLGGGDRGP